MGVSLLKDIKLLCNFVQIELDRALGGLIKELPMWSDWPLKSGPPIIENWAFAKDWPVQTVLCGPNLLSEFVPI